MEKVKLNEIEKIFIEEKASELTKEELKNIGYQTDGIITKDRLEIYRNQFLELTLDDVDRILSLTIKKDRITKIITFLGMLTAYTEDSQVNISYNAPASTGKSYIPIEISKLFPKEDVIKVGYSSPTAFFHSTGELDPETHLIKIDLSRKILIFLDQPHTELLQRLRPLLSHDQKELLIKITDKNKKGQNRTKNILLVGFPVVIFCTTNLKMDEQETSRVILLSPEMTEEKFKESIEQIIEKQSNKDFEKEIENDIERQLLKERIRVIKECRFEGVIINEIEKISKYYLEKKDTEGLTPIDQRNIGKLYSIIKGLTLLNFPHRKMQGKYIISNPNDVESGLTLWKEISKYQDLGIHLLFTGFMNKFLYPPIKKKIKTIQSQKGLRKRTYLDIIQKYSTRQSLING